ncbi:MAG: pentapeptide repeat-containing protein [Candidatus Omnitrophota bacterium]
MRDDLKCVAADCREQKLFGADACWEHLRDKPAYLATIRDTASKGASFSGGNFSKVLFRGFDLSRSDLSGANLSRADMSEATLFDANCRGAEFLGVNLTGADLTGADLGQADLTRANMSGARLWHANLEQANLIEADLRTADLWNAKMFNVRLWRTDLRDAVSLTRFNFMRRQNRFFSICRINEKGMNSAVSAYRGLKQYFMSKGKYDDASWASYKERNLEKRFLITKRDPMCVPSAVMDVFSGYGEKPYKVVISSLFMVFAYAFLYRAFDAVICDSSPSYLPNLSDCLYFSFVTFTTVGYGDFVPRAVSGLRMLAASEAFFGAFMMGLFIFTLARKYSAR